MLPEQLNAGPLICCVVWCGADGVVLLLLLLLCCCGLWNRLQTKQDSVLCAAHSAQ
jgi:hypothetical protein